MSVLFDFSFIIHICSLRLLISISSLLFVTRKYLLNCLWWCFALQVLCLCTYIGEYEAHIGEATCAKWPVEISQRIYSWRFALTAARTARFLWGLSREICQKVDVVWFEKLQSLWWSSQLGDNNVHLEATAVDLGGNLASGKPYWRDFGAKVWPFCGWCWMFGRVVGFVFLSAPPRNTKTLSGFWRAMLCPFGGHMQGWKQRFGPRLGPSLAILGPVKVYGSYGYASWGKVGGSWGQVGLSGGHVEAELGYVMLFWSYMLDCVRPCCWFCVQQCSPPSRPKILSGFLRAMFASFGVK